MYESTNEMAMYIRTLYTYKSYICVVNSVENEEDFEELKNMSFRIYESIDDLTTLFSDKHSKYINTSTCDTCKIDKIISSFKLNTEKIINLEKYEHLKIIKSFLYSDLKIIDEILNNKEIIKC